MTIKNNEYKWAYPLTKRNTTTHLILHHAAAVKASADGIHAYHLSNGWAGIAYHYFISKNGEIFRGRPEDMRGGHTENFNYCSIGICFEGNFDNEQMPKAQIEAGRELVSDIVSRYPAIIVGCHSDYARTNCPGKNFAFDEIVKKSITSNKNEEPSEWAKSACVWAIEKGLIRGDSNNCFRWHDFLTREELAVILERAMCTK